MDWIRHDLKYAVRALLRRPAMSALAIFTLAVGLGVNTVAFSAVNAIVFRPFHVPGGDKTGWIFTGTPQDPLASTSREVFDAITTQSRTLASLAAEGRAPLALQSGGETRQAWALMVSPRYFELIPPVMTMGRALGAADLTAGEIGVVVSERFWRRQLNGVTDLTASPLVLNRQTARVVGVVADGFQGPGGVFEPDLWVPLDAARQLSLPSADAGKPREWLTLIGRPRADVPGTAIAQELAPIVASATGTRAADVRIQYTPIIEGHPEARAFRPLAAVALAAVGIVLLIACFNVAGLLLAQSVDRQRDLGVRSALGASRGRLVRQLLTEGLLLGALAGSAALLLARWSEAILGTFALPAPIPQRIHFGTDWRLIAYAAFASLAASMLPTLVPAWQVWRSDLTRWIRASASSAVGGKAQARARRVFLVGQIAGSTVFLIVAAIFARSFITAYAADPGFDSRGTAIMEITPAQFGYSPARAKDLIHALVQQTAAIPGVRDVSAADRVPFFVGFPRMLTVNPDGRDCRTADCPSAMTYAVDGRHVAAMGFTLRAGRMFDDTRPADRDAVVITNAAAEKFWPNQYPVGQSFRDDTGRVRTVAGVLNDISQRMTRGETPQPYIYRPLEDADYATGLTIVARTNGDADALIAPMRAALHGIDPALPPDSLKTMRERMALPLWPTRTLAGFFGTCSVLALLLAMVGLFGVTHYVVGQRTREFGVRLAIGASGSTVQRMVLGESLRLIAPGVVIGLAAGIALSTLVKSQLLGLERADPRIFVAAVVVEVFVALAAAWIPARRAAMTNPLVALRAD
ncbi:MAG: ABC transporter permease [Acidobacteria bacterium]|nr:ABC transporter permease [Acidobacteriota bacterium]